MIDWNNVINNLTNGQVVTVDPARWNMNNPEYAEMLTLWQDNNFNTNSVKWINYYNTKDLETELAKCFHVTPLRSWISCVEPGYMTGYHYDIDDNEKEYLKHGELKRFSVFMSKPSIGQLFILGTNYYFNMEQGATISWISHKDWHNGINGSLANKYMFHLIGY
jgi:hypothetical protein